MQPSDLEFASLISSKICHDIIGPIGAICNGLEMVSSDKDTSASFRALDIVRDVSEQLSARLKFARFAFGTSALNTSLIELNVIQELIQGLTGDRTKHQVVWDNIIAEPLFKIHAKLLLNLVACAIATLPRGGVIIIEINFINSKPNFSLLCNGKIAQPARGLKELLDNANNTEIDPFSVQAYYTLRLANEIGMQLSIDQHSNNLQLTAKTLM